MTSKVTQSTNTSLYIIHALSHLHPGSGDTGYGVVDKTVQRDPLDLLPVIHGSSLKGAFREAFEQYYPPAENESKKFDHPLIEYIFGSGIGSTRGKSSKEPDRISGSHRFHEARLLSIPVRSNVRPFFRATSPIIARELVRKNELLSLGLSDELVNALNTLGESTPNRRRPQIFSSDEDVWLEEFLAEKGSAGHGAELEKLFGENLAVFHHDDLKELCAHLPIIARNYLENGISRNLWYEEIVPRETRFFCIIQAPDQMPTMNYSSEYLQLQQSPAPIQSVGFTEVLSSTLIPAHQVQIGANASVGYGLCHISVYPQPKNSNETSQ